MFASLKNALSPSAMAVFAMAIGTGVVVALLPVEKAQGIEFWVISSAHRDSYLEHVAQWGREHPQIPFTMRLLHASAAERQMLSGFLSGTPMADMLEVHEGIYPKAFLGPVEQIGFLDITDRLHEEGLYEQINEPSFSTMTSRGQIFGLPHDVHPVLLAYRSDIVEAAGIGVSQIEIWDDYFCAMRPLMADHDGDGRPDRYLLNLSELMAPQIALLLLQNNGLLFDEDDSPVFASERNARTLATIMTWLVGPQRVATEVTGSISGGNRQHLEGTVIGNLMTDWQLGGWKLEIPQLAGKIKLMPLPAFERGGRRTSVWGGSMIGINKRSTHIEACWEMAKYLYTSADVAEKTWRLTNILSPVKALWHEPFYHEPDLFCSGQRVGTLYIEAAPDVPRRSSSPYTNIAFARISSVAIALRSYAEQHGIYDAETLAPEALRLLQIEQESLRKLISRNIFFGEAEQTALFYDIP